MKLQIKTLERKSLMIDIEEAKTVYDLKKELSLYADVGVKPELQKLIYNGKILNNNDQLSTYNIDVKKYLVIMILKQPLEEPPPINVAKEQQDISVSSKTSTDAAVVSEVKSADCVKAEDNGISSAEQGGDIDDLVKRITSMGFSEVEVRQALKAFSNNPNHAIDYLIASTPSPTYGLGTDQVIDVRALHSINPLEFCRRDEAFNNMRRAIFQNPELLNAGIQQIAETNPSLLNIVDENQEDFLAMLLENMSNESDDNDEAGD